MKKFLLTVLAVLGFTSQAGSKTTISLDQITAPTITSVMVSVPGKGWTPAQLDPSLALDTTTTPPTLRAIPTAASQPSWVTPSGTLDGVNAVFTLPSAPNPPGALTVARNGLVLTQVLSSGGGDYTLSGTTITFVAGAVPLPGDTLRAK